MYTVIASKGQSSLITTGLALDPRIDLSPVLCEVVDADHNLSVLITFKVLHEAFWYVS
jgi:hypothetical protein